MIRAVLAVFVSTVCCTAVAEQSCFPETIAATAPSERFTRAGETVIDSVTGLMWRKCLQGLTGDACESGNVVSVNWGEALLLTSRVNMSGDGSGYSDWRLPNIRELSTLVEVQCAQPAINREVFPGAQPLHVWSSSPYHFYTHYSWYVDFANGAPTYDDRTAKKALWLVRDAD